METYAPLPAEKLTEISKLADRACALRRFTPVLTDEMSGDEMRQLLRDAAYAREQTTRDMLAELDPETVMSMVVELIESRVDAAVGR
jgi:hypothetical protein